MCMITYVPGGIDLPEDGIRNGSYTNDDGHGWAIASNDGIQIGKSMDFDTAWDELVEARKDHGKRALVMFHSRFATHGTVDEFNVHPFWADEYTAVAHNGILPVEWHPSKKDKRSDTQILVDHTIPHYLSEHTGVPSRKGGKLLGKMIGQGNKLTILSVASGVPKVRIVNAHQGVHHEGVWYSNSGYLKPWNSYYGSGYRTPSRTLTWDDRDWVYDSDTKSYIPANSVWDKVEAEDSTVADVIGADQYEDRACDVCGVSGTVRLETGWCEHCKVCSTCYYDDKFCTCTWNQRLMLESSGEAEVIDSMNPEFSNAGASGWDSDLGGWVLG